MIKCVIGLEQPDSGSILVMNEEINKLEQTLDRITHRNRLFISRKRFVRFDVRSWEFKFPLRRHMKNLV